MLLGTLFKHRRSSSLQGSSLVRGRVQRVPCSRAQMPSIGIQGLNTRSLCGNSTLLKTPICPSVLFIEKRLPEPQARRQSIFRHSPPAPSCSGGFQCAIQMRAEGRDAPQPVPGCAGTEQYRQEKTSRPMPLGQAQNKCPVFCEVHFLQTSSKPSAPNALLLRQDDASGLRTTTVSSSRNRTNIFPANQPDCYVGFVFFLLQPNRIRAGRFCDVPILLHQRHRARPENLTVQRLSSSIQSAPISPCTLLREALPDLAATRHFLKGHRRAAESSLAAGPAWEEVASPMVANIPSSVQGLTSPLGLCTCQQVLPAFGCAANRGGKRRLGRSCTFTLLLWGAPSPEGVMEVLSGAPVWANSGDAEPVATTANWLVSSG